MFIIWSELEFLEMRYSIYQYTLQYGISEHSVSIPTAYSSWNK